MKQPGLDRADRNVECLGDLSDAQALTIEERDGRLLFERE
jgi:hypothetical protein